MEHIYLYGDIFPDDGQIGEMFGTVSLSTVSKQLQAIQGDEVTVHIRSNGGSVTEGFGIYDVLKTSGKKITTIAEGMCASIATVVFLAGEDRKITENCEFLIHFPWAMAIGTADDLEEAAEQIREAENKLIDFYVDKTGSDRDVLITYMEKDKVITATQAKTLGFATEIVKTINAEMRTNLIAAQIKNKEDMSNILNKLTEWKNSLLGKTEPEQPEQTPEIVNFDITTANPDVTLRFKSQGEPVQGDEVTMASGESADGEHLMPNGDTYIVANGKLAEIRIKQEPEANPVVENTDEVIAQKDKEIADKEAEIVAKNQEIETLKNQHAQAMAELEEKISKEIEEIKRLTVSNYTPPKREEPFRKEEPAEKSQHELIKERKEKRLNEKN